MIKDQFLFYHHQNHNIFAEYVDKRAWLYKDVK